jgi:hypothetical protein
VRSQAVGEAKPFVSIQSEVKTMVMSDEARREMERERSKQRREQDRALRVRVEQQMARTRRLQVIVGRALAESGLMAEFETALRG